MTTCAAPLRRARRCSTSVRALTRPRPRSANGIARSWNTTLSRRRSTYEPVRSARASSMAQRRRIDVETERCRERRAAQARAQSEGIVARIGHAARYGPEVAGQHVAVLFREVRIGVIEAELEHAVAERQ